MTEQHGGELACVDELMARMSHELRTPLNAILGFSEILERQLHGPLGTERYRDYAADIRASGLSLLAAVEEALAVTQQLAEARVPLREAVGGSIDISRRAASTRLTA